jgi:ATP-dependent Lon protease
LSEGTALNTAKGLTDKIKTLSEENINLKADAEKKQKEESHNKLFTENKINKAQLDALNSGKEMLEVLSLSENMNNTPAGSKEADNKEVKLSEDEKAIAKKLGLTDDEFYSANYGGAQ